MIDPLVESDGDGVYRVRTFTPENVCLLLPPPLTLLQSFYATAPEQADRIFGPFLASRLRSPPLLTGPLVDGMVVSLSHLAILVRRLVINSHRDRTNHLSHFEQPPRQSAASPIPPLVSPSPLPSCLC
jgi:hypothetical protein